MTPLMDAVCWNDNPEVITALLQAGAKIYDQDRTGMTPLTHWAVGSKKPEEVLMVLVNEIIRVLVNASADDVDEVLAHLGKTRTIELLITLVQNVGDSSFRTTVCGALHKVTLQSFGENPHAWAVWWKQNKGIEENEDVMRRLYPEKPEKYVVTRDHRLIKY